MTLIKHMSHNSDKFFFLLQHTLYIFLAKSHTFLKGLNIFYNDNNNEELKILILIKIFLILLMIER